ncbi:MAG: GvpL/GvpF family gas vesicle protein [Alphaproteobacteria bacterium]|nr:MAG: GvpL/GvpF family gas vesicle protein [Alphaproteobacteria bacterium]
MNKDNENGKYVYCIIKTQEEQESFGNIGFEGKEVYTIKYKNFSPVVSDVFFKKYDLENEEDIKTHTHVVNEVMKKYSAIPVAYGMVFKNKKLVDISMRSGYKAMQKAIKIVDNKVELGVKVILPKDYDGDRQKSEECRSEFSKSLNQIAFDSKELSLFSKRLIMNVSFLVERDKVEAFSDEVEKLETKYDSFRVQYSGPWSPYNFVDIHILSKQRGGFR